MGLSVDHKRVGKYKIFNIRQGDVKKKSQKGLMP